MSSIDTRTDNSVAPELAIDAFAKLLNAVSVAIGLLLQ